MQCLLFLAGLSAEREVATQGGTFLLGNRKEITGKEGKMHLGNRRGSCQSSNH